MEDLKIIELFNQRNEIAIEETAKKYGHYCYSIANHILNSFEDSQEIVNDTYLACWNSIPPHQPTYLPAYLGKITRNLSIDIYRKKQTDKRGNGKVEIILDELGDIIGKKNAVEEQFNETLLTTTINQFLEKQNKKNRMLFIARYFYNQTIEEIAEEFHMKENNVAVSLQRIRNKLQQYLKESGYEL